MKIKDIKGTYRGKIFDAMSISVELNNNRTTISYQDPNEEFFETENETCNNNIIAPLLANYLEDCKVIDFSIPKNWSIIIEGECLELSPKSWHEYKSTANFAGHYISKDWDCLSNFWEDLSEGEYSAINLYIKESAIIKGIDYKPLEKTKPDARELLEIQRRKARDKAQKEGKPFNQALFPPPIAITSTDEW